MKLMKPDQPHGAVLFFLTSSTKCGYLLLILFDSSRNFKPDDSRDTLALVKKNWEEIA